jgi:hypothetical protein
MPYLPSGEIHVSGAPAEFSMALTSGFSVLSE